MDELSWRARLAKSNTNILDIHDGMVFLEFTYHPKAGVFKWCKTYIEVNEEDLDLVPWTVAQAILDKVLELRKELEG